MGGYTMKVLTATTMALIALNSLEVFAKSVDTAPEQGWATFTWGSFTLDKKYRINMYRENKISCNHDDVDQLIEVKKVKIKCHGETVARPVEELRKICDDQVDCTFTVAELLSGGSRECTDPRPILKYKVKCKALTKTVDPFKPIVIRV